MAVSAPNHLTKCYGSDRERTIRPYSRKVQKLNPPMVTTATKSKAVSVVEFRNCRHPFGGSLSFDVVVDGVYPSGKQCIMLTQAAEVYHGVKLQAPTAYFNIPVASIETAMAVVDATGSYQLCGKFRKGEPISVHLCWPYAPAVDWSIMAR